MAIVLGIGVIHLRINVRRRNLLVVLECDHDSRDVIERLCEHALVERLVDGKTRLLMNRDGLALLEHVLVNILAQDLVVLEVASGGVPTGLDDLLVVLLLEHTIAAEHDEVIIVANSEAFDLGRGNNAHRIATVARVLRFDVANGARYGETTGEDSMRTDDHLEAGGVVGRRVRHVALILIDLTAILFDAARFLVVLRLVVLGQEQDLLAAINRHDGSAVAHVGNVADVADNEHDNGAGSTALHEVVLRSTLLMSPLEEHLLSLSKAALDGQLGVTREVLIANNQLMQLVAQEVGAG